MLQSFKQRAQQLKRETYTLYVALRDPRVPWYARLFGACVIGYALSPIDLIPDFIPVLGYLDDLILIPLGMTLVLKMVPGEVMVDSRMKAEAVLAEGRPTSRAAAAIIIAIWILLAVLAIKLVAGALIGSPPRSSQSLFQNTPLLRAPGSHNLPARWKTLEARSSGHSMPAISNSWSTTSPPTCASARRAMMRSTGDWAKDRRSHAGVAERRLSPRN